jgi:hypothetical protein
MAYSLKKYWDLTSYYPPGIHNFEAAHRFLENMCTPDYNNPVKLLRSPAENIPVVAA